MSADTLQHYSYSCLSVLDQCPARWHWKYIEGHEEPTSPEAERGRLVHEAVEKYVRHCAVHRLDTDIRFAGQLARQLADPYAAQVVSRLGDFLAVDPSTVIADGAGVEREFSHLTAAGDVVQGRFDRLDWNEAEEELIVTDYKSARQWTMPPEPTKQLRLYGWAALKERPHAQYVTLKVLYLGSRREGSWTLEADDPLIGEAWLQQWIDDAKARTVFPECPGSWCGYCGRLEECAKGRLARECAITDEGEARDVAGSVLVYEAAATRLRKQLDQWRREHDLNIRIGDIERADLLPEWYLKGQHHADLDPDADLWEFLEKLRESGLDLRKAIKFDAAILGQAFDAPDPDSLGEQIFGDPGAASALGDLVPYLKELKPSARAGWRKVKSSDEDDDALAGDTEGAE